MPVTLSIPVPGTENAARGLPQGAPLRPLGLWVKLSETAPTGARAPRTFEGKRKERKHTSGRKKTARENEGGCLKSESGLTLRLSSSTLANFIGSARL